MHQRVGHSGGDEGTRDGWGHVEGVNGLEVTSDLFCFKQIKQYMK